MSPELSTKHCGLKEFTACATRVVLSNKHNYRQPVTGIDPDQRSIWKAIGEAATERQSLTLAFAGMALGVVAHLVAPDSKLPSWIVFYATIAFAIVAWILMAALKKALQNQRLDLPKVLTIIADQEAKIHPILLLAPSTLFGSSTLVSVYHRDQTSGFEVLIGHGTVRTVQSDMKIQVQIDQWVEGNGDLISALCNKNGEVLRQLIVRPSIVREQQWKPSGDDLSAAVVRNWLMHISRTAANPPTISEAETDDGKSK